MNHERQLNLIVAYLEGVGHNHESRLLNQVVLTVKDLAEGVDVADAGAKRPS